MRMRKKKNGEARLSACAEYLMSPPVSPFLSPADAFSRPGAPVFLEIGAGKGSFAVGMCKKHPDALYLAMEKVSDCVVLAAELAKSELAGDTGLRFIIDTADNLAFILGKGTVDKIFLNFSDPWSKKGYAKRRLTHRRYLSLYMYLLKDGGTLTFKTDNDGLFDFSLEEIEAIGLFPVKLTRDLHASEWSEGNVVTEYEKAFSSAGKNINMLEIVKPAGFSLPLAEEFSLERRVYGDNRNG